MIEQVKSILTVEYNSNGEWHLLGSEWHTFMLEHNGYVGTTEQVLKSANDYIKTLNENFRVIAFENQSFFGDACGVQGTQGVQGITKN